MSSNSRSTHLARAGKWILLLGLLGGVALGARRAISGASVSCVHARRGPLSQRLVLTGRVITPGTARLGVVTLGTVSTVHVDAGSHVTLGQSLLELNDAEQRAAVVQARAGVLLSAAQMGQVKRITNQIAGASVDEARVAVDQACRDPWVLVVENGRARRVSVVTGVRDDKQVELVNGIDERARIINTAGIADGVRVRALGES